MQCRRQARRPADPRGAGPRRADERRAHLQRRQDLLRAQRHLDLEQGGHQRPAGQGRPGAVRPQQPQVHPPRRTDPLRRQAGVPGDGAQLLRLHRRHRRALLRRAIHPCGDCRGRPGQGPAGAAVPPGGDPARHLRRHHLRRPPGGGEDRQAVRLHPVRLGLGGLRAVHPDDARQLAAAARSRPGRSGTVRHPVGAQAAGRVLAVVADPQEGPPHQGSAALLQPQAAEQRLHDACLDQPVLSDLRGAGCQRADA
ncbi:hypothetical protein D3C81_1214290 [compost metagenome]